MSTSSQNKNSSIASALRRSRVATFVVLLFELVLLGGAIALYCFDFPKGFHDAMKVEYWFIAFAVAIVVNILILWVTQLAVGHIRQRNDVEAASVIGGDIQEAYKFGQIGLVVTDDNDIVMWTNALFKDRGFDLLDMNVMDWKPELADLKKAPADASKKIEANGRTYNVKFLPDAHMYIFRDCTDFESLCAYSKEQAPVIGILMMDNYSEIAGNAEDDNNDVITKVRAAIFDYAKQNGVLLRRFRNDSYFLVCNYSSLQKMENDNFSILEKTRAIGKGENVVPTLSIGLAHDFADVIKLHDMASNAIDIAMSRGGDQAVVSQYGQDLHFYGGKTAAIENAGRVQFRSVADSMISLIKTASGVIVSGHLDMDMDALAGCLGVKAICDYCKVPCKIVFDPKLTEKKTRYAFTGSFTKAELDEITLTPKEAVDAMRPTTLFVVVDVSVPSRVMGQKAMERSVKRIVIDHHRRGEQFIENPVLSYVDPSASSTAEIMAEFIHYATANPRIEVSPLYATLMLSGMFLDTNFFKSKSTGIRSFEAAEILKEFGADNQAADDFLKDEYEEYALVNNIVSTLRTPYTGVVYCVSSDKDIVEQASLSKVANQLMQLKGINACFVIGRTGTNETRISARSDGTINVQLLCEKMGGGGHFGAAAVAFRDVAVSGVESKLVDTLDTYLSEAKSDSKGERE